ncbi:NUDIX hydrolase [Brevibacterium salitolerans]|uniref:NUDIX hydrolase n=1 Tax=Brevibacterium salitolerans TaxID=1403566 RepID=UPI0031CF0102
MPTAAREPVRGLDEPYGSDALRGADGRSVAGSVHGLGGRPGAAGALGQAGPVTPLSRANVRERAQISPDLAVSSVVFALADRDGESRRGTGAGGSGGGGSGGGADDDRTGGPGAPAPEAGEAPALELLLPLVRRVREPFRGCWALPGGPLRMYQSLEEVAVQHLREATGLEPGSVEQLHTFGGLDRSPGLRVVSVVYWAVLPLAATAAALDRTEEAENVAWFPAGALPDLAFDHAEIIAYALRRLRSSVSWGRLARDVLGTRFTLAQLREAGECVAGRRLDPGNFQRQAKADPQIVPTEEFLTGGRHRPPRLYTTTA